MHARGPVGVAQLTSFKYVVHGDGQTAARDAYCRRFARGMRIGLFGGSFNPPHAGHALVCAIALAPRWAWTASG